MKSTVILNGKEYEVIDVTTNSVWSYVEVIRANDGSALGYRVTKNIAHFSARYGKWIGCEAGDKSDGATFAKDINSFCWLFHDELCNDGEFECGTKCNNWQASHVMTDIMVLENYYFRSITWFWATWIVGGGKARENGMF